MLTGKRAFAAVDVSETIAAVLREEPAFDSIPAEVPERLRLVLRLCLRKDLTKRFQSIGGIRLPMEGAFDGAAASPIARVGGVSSTRLGSAVAASLIVGAVAAAWWSARLTEAPSAVVRFSLVIVSPRRAQG